MAKKDNTFEALQRLGLCHVTHSLKEPQGDASICLSVFFPPLLVLSGVYHKRTFLFFIFPGVLTKWKYGAVEVGRFACHIGGSYCLTWSNA